MKKLNENLKTFLQKVEKVFPYDTMGLNFKGKHYITLDNGEIILGIWYKNEIHQVGLEDDDFNDVDLLLTNLKIIFENAYKSCYENTKEIYS